MGILSTLSFLGTAIHYIIAFAVGLKIYWRQHIFQNRVCDIDCFHSDQVNEVPSLNIDNSVYATTIQLDKTMDRIDHLKAENEILIDQTMARIDHLKAENESLKTEMIKMEERQRCEINRVFESLSQRLDECF